MGALVACAICMILVSLWNPTRKMVKDMEVSAMERKQHVVLNADELVGILRVSRPTVYKYLREGTIPSVKVGRRILIPQKALDDFLNGKPAQ